MTGQGVAADLLVILDDLDRLAEHLRAAATSGRDSRATGICEATTTIRRRLGIVPYER